MPGKPTKENFYEMVDARINQKVSTAMESMTGSVSAVAGSVETLATNTSHSMDSLAARIKALEDAAAVRANPVTDLSETQPVVTLSLAGLNLLGANQVVIAKKVNEILNRLRVKTIKS